MCFSSSSLQKQRLSKCKEMREEKRREGEGDGEGGKGERT